MRGRREKQSKELIKRGEILIDPDVIQLKQQKEKKLGRPYKYPRALVLLFLFFKSILRLPYRQTEDLVKNILKQLEPSAQLPNFRTIQYRHATEGLKLDSSPQDLEENFVALVDPSGIKLTSREEWLSEKYDEERKKNWLRLNVTLDVGNCKLLEISTNSQQVPEEQN